jgi:HEAT repeat protein
VTVLAALLQDPDRRIAAKAANALAKSGADDALAALSGTFGGGGSYDAQVVAVFALRDIGSPEAMRILRQVRAAPPDPRLEKALDLALDINTDRH